MLWPPAWSSWLRWHWGGSPNHWWTRAAHYEWEAIVTVGEQQELYDAAWLILKAHGVVSDTTDYALATQLADKLTALRDRQRQFSEA